MRKDLEKLVRKLKRQRKQFGKDYPYAVVDIREIEKILNREWRTVFDIDGI